jgi:tetratricopeptide (TPR) repeat protein
MTKADAAAGKLIEAFANAEGIAAAIEDVADKYQMAGSHAKSYPLHRYVVEHWPENERAIWCQMKAIMSQLRLGDLAKAEQELGTLLTDFAGHKELGPAVHEVVEEYRNTGAHEQGRELFGYLLENWDETPDTMLELQVGIALQSIKLRQPNRVEAAIEQLIADYNDHPKIGKALFQIAEEYFYALKYRQCVELLEVIRDKYPEKEFFSKPELPYMAAHCYSRLHDYDKAVSNYRRCFEEYPQGRYSSRAPFWGGMACMLWKKDYEQAVELFELQRQLYPGTGRDAMALYRIAVCYHIYLKDYATAAETFEEFIATYPDDLNVWSCYAGLGDCYAKLGDTEQALAVLQEGYDKCGSESMRKEFIGHMAAARKGGVQ